MFVIALDTSSPQGSLALARWDGAFSFELIAEKNWQREKSHSELLTSTFEQLLHSQNVRVQDLAAVFVGNGPGSFTGIRVGVSFARTLGFSLGCPVWPVNSLRLWAEVVPDKARPTLVVMRAFRDLVYAALYQHDQARASELLPPFVAIHAELSKHLPEQELNVVGDGWVPFILQWPKSLVERVHFAGNFFPQAASLFSIFVQDRPDLQNHNWKLAKPLYIRGSEAEEKLRHGLLKPVTRRL